MKAWAISRFGGPDVLSLQELADPAVGPRDVLIEVVAASLNPIDFKLREGKTRLVVRHGFPHILGCDVAGRVRAAGPGVTRFRAGDEVFARLEKARMGGLAELVAADESVVAFKPARASFAEAASLPLAGLTSLQALRDVAKLPSGARVLIHAGAGGVGTLAIQIAKILGLSVATTTSTKNVELVRGLGADDVIDYTREDFATRGRVFDAVFDTLGGASESKSFEVVKPGGIVVGIGGLPDVAFARESLPWFALPVVWLGGLGRERARRRAGARYAFLFMRADGGELGEIAAWVDEGRMKAVLHRTYPFVDTKEAFAELERGRSRGKIVVQVG